MAQLNDRAAAFAAACLAAFTKHATTPINHPAPDLSDGSRVQIMRSSAKPHNCVMNPRTLQHNNLRHFPTSQETAEAIDLVKWVFAVAKLPADSPRFAYYVSRWDVPNKIARAKSDGSFSDAIANCPPIDPGWIRFVPDALEAHRQFAETYLKPKNGQPKLLTQKRRAA